MSRHNVGAEIGQRSSSKSSENESKAKMRRQQPIEVVTVGEDEESTQPENIGDVVVTSAPDNLHIGTEATFNGPVNIVGLTTNDLVWINQNCDKCVKRKSKNQKHKLKTNKSKNGDLRQVLMRQWSPKKFFVLLASLVVVQVIVVPIFILFREFTGTKIPYNCDGIKAKEIQEMNEKLREDRVLYRRPPGFEDNCSFDCCLKNKIFKISVSILHPNLGNYLVVNSLSYPLRYGDDNEKYLFKKYFKEEFERHRNWSLNDIYYNYIVGLEGVILGRPLFCPFEEKEEDLTEDHSSVITIGIPFVPVIQFREWQKYIARWMDRILLELQKTGILSRNYTIEVPSVFSETVPSFFTIENVNKIKYIDFYEKFVDDTLTAYLITVRDLLFLPAFDVDGNQVTADNSTDYLIPLYHNVTCDIKDLNRLKYSFVVIRNTIKFHSSHLHRDNRTSSKSFARLINNRFNKSMNYLMVNESVFKGIPFECSTTFSDLYFLELRNTIDVYVEHELMVNTTHQFFKLLHLVANDIRNYYSVVDQTSHYVDFSRCGSHIYYDSCGIQTEFLFDCKFNGLDICPIISYYNYVTNRVSYFKDKETYPYARDC